MRRNTPVTQREAPMADSDVIISTTTLKGVVDSVNEDFLRISGFTEDELIGQAHNIVRHPDMPQAAFQDLWKVIDTGQPWMGLVKNRCKNGDHYYVDAYVTPIFDGSKMTGFQSVRVKPARSVIDRAEGFYRALRENKLRRWRAYMPANLGYGYKAMLLALAVSAPSVLAVLSGGSWLVALLTALLATGLSWTLVQPLLELAARSRETFENPVTQQVYTGRGDELGQLELVLQAQRAQLRTILGRVRHSSHDLGLVADTTSEVVAETRSGVDRQQREVEQVATAMNEMSATVNEVARNAEETAEASRQVLSQTEAGELLLEQTIAGINELSHSVDRATDVIEALKIDSEKIGSVVDVISNIASETNLLALNAAIEAARAGEQGRGFAVVADEVRNLASNTQNSTDEIQQMIKRIQQTSAEAVSAMAAGKQHAEQGAEQIAEVGTAFTDISRGVGRISDMNTQVATASEEQSAVSEEINRNVVHIMDIANGNNDSAQATADASDKLNGLVHELETMLQQFGRIK